VAAVHINSGGIYRAAGDLTRADTAFQQAHQILLGLDKTHPKNVNYQRMLAGSYVNLGVILDVRGEEEKSLRLYQQALAIQEKLRTGPNKKGTGNVGLALESAQSYRRVGDCLAALHRYPEALPALTESRAILEQLVKENPALEWLKGELAATLRKLAYVTWRQNDGPGALELYERAANLLTELIKLRPTSSSSQSELARVWFDIGLVHTRDRNWTDARSAYESARLLQEKLVAAEPEQLDRHFVFGQTLGNLGLTHALLGQEEQAVAELRHAITEHSLVVSRAPRSPHYQASLLKAYVGLAQTLQKSGKQAEGRRVLAEAQQFFQKLAEAHPQMASVQESLAKLQKLLRQVN
jgi:tetratricopeptide (TPR) repeat protein